MAQNFVNGNLFEAAHSRKLTDIFHAWAARQMLIDDDGVLLVKWRGFRRIARAEKGDDRRADGVGKVHGAGIVRNHQIRIAQQQRKLAQRRFAGKIAQAFRRADSPHDLIHPFALGGCADKHERNWLRRVREKLFAQRDPCVERQPPR